MIEDLDPYKLEQWLVFLLDSPPNSRRALALGAPLPLLGPDTPPSFWLSDQYKTRPPPFQDYLRTSVVNLLRTECRAQEIQDPVAVLARLADVAGLCGFPEVLDKLVSCISTDAFPNGYFDECGFRRSLRAVLWKHVLGWSHSVDLVPLLIRDLPRKDCVALCFNALGDISAATLTSVLPQVILHIPSTAWSRLVSNFLRRLGPLLLGPTFQTPWKCCLRTLTVDAVGANTLSTGDGGEIEGAFFVCLRDAGFQLGHDENNVGLVITHVSQPALRIEYHPEDLEFALYNKHAYELELTVQGVNLAQLGASEFAVPSPMACVE